MGRHLIPWLIIGLLAPWQVWATDLPKPFAATYTLTLRGITAGEVNLTLQQIGENRYRYRRSSHTTGLLAVLRPQSIDEFSDLEWVNGRYRPVSYSYLKQGSKHRQVRIEFNWKAGTATNYVDGDHWSMRIPDGTWDKLSVELAVVMDLRKSGSPGIYPVADGGQLKHYEFLQLGRETVETAAGSFETLVIQRTRTKNAKRRTRLWMAPSLNYVPARVHHENKGEGDGEVNLVSIRQLP